MKNKLFVGAIALVYLVGYCDWLQPGFLKFALPASWDRPLSTAKSYDLGAGVRNTAKCVALEAIPDWAKPGNWRLGPRTEEPKTCKQKLKESEQ